MARNRVLKEDLEHVETSELRSPNQIPTLSFQFVLYSLNGWLPPVSQKEWLLKDIWVAAERVTFNQTFDDHVILSYKRTAMGTWLKVNALAATE